MRIRRVFLSFFVGYFFVVLWQPRCERNRYQPRLVCVPLQSPLCSVCCWKMDETGPGKKKYTANFTRFGARPSQLPTLLPCSSYFLHSADCSPPHFFLPLQCYLEMMAPHHAHTLSQWLRIKIFFQTNEKALYSHILVFNLQICAVRLYDSGGGLRLRNLMIPQKVSLF